MAVVSLKTVTPFLRTSVGKVRKLPCGSHVTECELGRSFAWNNGEGATDLCDPSITRVIKLSLSSGVLPDQ